MTDRIVKPVRAWAEFDQWAMFLMHWAMEQGADRTSGWDVWQYPSGIKWVPQQHRRYGRLPDAIGYPDTEGRGSLRSLRVVYDNDIELKLQCYASINGLDPEKRHWHWYLRGVDAAGDLAEDKDSEAVERAMIGAAAWFTQAQVVPSN